MKFNELFKKIEFANEINEKAGLPKVVVGFTYYYDKTRKFETLKELKKYIKDEFTLADEILNCEFEVGKEQSVSAVVIGSLLETTFLVELYTKLRWE